MTTQGFSLTRRRAFTLTRRRAFTLTRRRAFTLIELVLYMGLFTIFITVLTGIFISVLDVQTKSESTSSVQQDSRYILSRIIYDIHRASAIVTPASAGQVSNSINLTIGGVTYVYASSSGELHMTVGGVDNVLTSYATRVSNFSLTRLGNPSGKHTLTIDLGLASESESKNYQISVGLR